MVGCNRLLETPHNGPILDRSSRNISSSNINSSSQALTITTRATRSSRVRCTARDLPNHNKHSLAGRTPNNNRHRQCKVSFLSEGPFLISNGMPRGVNCMMMDVVDSSGYERYVILVREVARRF